MSLRDRFEAQRDELINLLFSNDQKSAALKLEGQLLLVDLLPMIEAVKSFDPLVARKHSALLSALQTDPSGETPGNAMQDSETIESWAFNKDSQMRIRTMLRLTRIKSETITSYAVFIERAKYVREELHGRILKQFEVPPVSSQASQ